jgi:hypothetical protein
LILNKNCKVSPYFDNKGVDGTCLMTWSQFATPDPNFANNAMKNFMKKLKTLSDMLMKKINNMCKMNIRPE